MAKFRRGGLSLAIKHGVPLVPITLVNSYKLIDQKRTIRRAAVKVIIDPTVFPDQMTEEEKKRLPKVLENQLRENLALHAE